MNEVDWLRLRGEIAALELMVGMLLARDAVNKGGINRIERLRGVLRDALAALPAASDQRGTIAEEAMNECYERVFEHAISVLRQESV